MVIAKYTDGNGDEDEGAPKPLPGGCRELGPIEQQSLESGVIELCVTQGGVSGHILVQHGHQDHWVRSVQEVEHHNEELLVHHLYRKKEA